MPTNITGAGPYTWELPSLDPGDEWRINFNKYEKGTYRADAPFESALFKNYDPDNRVIVEINGGAKGRKVDVDPSGKDTYDDVGIVRLLVRNEGQSTIPEDQVTVTVKSDPYGADERALEEKTEPPLRGVVRKFTGI